jgi:glutamate carboxypeptidase
MKDKLFKVIESLEQDYIKVWEDVCNIESPTRHKEGVDKVGAYFAKMAKDRGFKVEVKPFEKAGDVVVITANAESKERPISFSGHLDTVHPVGSFGSPAVKIDGDKIYGPGVSDCKGGIVAAFLAIDALIKCGYTKRPLQLLLQTDEEHSMSQKGCIKHICETAKDAVAFFNVESNASYGEACLWRKGIATFTFNVEGIEAHSSQCATQGANAIREASYKILELEKFKDADGITCNVGTISGGTVANTVPGSCTFKANFRFSTAEELEQITKFCKDLADKVYVKGCKTTAEHTGFRIAMEDSEKNHDLLNKMNEIYVKNGMPELKPIKKLGGSDAADVTAYGIPCVECLGVIGGRIHSPDEYADLKSLTYSAKLLAVASSEL